MRLRAGDIVRYKAERVLGEVTKRVVCDELSLSSIRAGMKEAGKRGRPLFIQFQDMPIGELEWALEEQLTLIKRSKKTNKARRRGGFKRL